jgi:outer membrane receptor protein involved in Fe transport
MAAETDLSKQTAIIALQPHRRRRDHPPRREFALGGDKSLDTIQDKRFTVDLATAYQFTRHYGLYFNVKNLANTPLPPRNGARSPGRAPPRSPRPRHPSPKDPS